MPITDNLARGLTVSPIEALRYDGQTDDPFESAGITLKMIPIGARVLDVGCGTGTIATLIRDIRQADIIGIEPNSERAQKARERGITVINSELTDHILYDLGMFDVILFADVLEHLADPTGMLILIRKALSPSGCVIASVPNVAHWTVRYNLLHGRFDYEPTGIMDVTHLRWFTDESIKRLFDSAQYEVQQKTVSAGVWLNAYSYKRPFMWLNPRLRNFIIRRATMLWPNFFGCQHVIQARPRRVERT